MSSRRLEPAVPIALWLCAAIVVHYVSYRGVDEVAGFATDRRDLRDFAASVRATARAGGAGETFEVALDGPIPPPDVPPTDAPKPPPPAPPKPKEAERKAEPPKPPPAVKEKVVDVVPVPAPEVKPPPQPKQDKRVAVEQHVKDKNQEDNPNAHFLGDDANRVQQESVARITAHDRNDEDPSPGTHNDGPSPEIGNADASRIADSTDHAGDPTHTPGEKSIRDKSVEPRQNARADAAKAMLKETEPPSTQEGKNGVAGPQAAAQPNAARTPLPAVAEPKPSDASTAAEGSYSVNPRRDPRANPAPVAATGGVGAASENDLPYSIPRLGGGAGPNGRNLNLSPGGAIAAIGEQTLAREREADGERRRSAHRGTFRTPDLKRWRAQIENYVAVVKPGNTTALNTARAPFAAYLVRLHDRLHPIFADGYLDSLDRLGQNAAENRPENKTSLEIILNKDDGRIMRMGVVSTSGVTAFDSAALEAMQRASPFGKAPEAIVSVDGNVYLHWEFHRNRDIACSTVNARPIMLKTAPAVPVEPGPLRGPRAPTDPREQGSPSREGATPPPQRQRAG